MLADVARWFLWFIAYSFAGWVYESILCSLMAKKPVNRGFLNGPICPVYGCGALAGVLCLSGFAGNLPALFLLGALLTCTIEYLTAWILETLFHAKWWDYSDRKFNLQGRVCLLGAVAFGAMTVALVEWIQPWMTAQIDRIPQTLQYALAGTLLAFLLADLFVTVRSLVRIDKLLADMEDAMKSVLKKPQALAGSLKETLLSSDLADRIKKPELPDGLKEAVSSLKKQTSEHADALRGFFEDPDVVRRFSARFRPLERFQHRRLREAFPHFRHLRFDEGWSQLQERLTGKARKDEEEK